MRRIYLNVFCALLIIAIAAVSATRADDSNFERVIQDYKLQLATYSILNTDTPIQLGIPTYNEAAPAESPKDVAPVKEESVSTLSGQKDEEPQAETKPQTESRPQSEPSAKKLVSKPKSDEKTKVEPKIEDVPEVVISETIVKEKPPVKESVAENSSRSKAAVSKKETTASDGWNSVSRKTVSILETQPEPIEASTPQPTKPHELALSDSTLPEPQETFEDIPKEESVAVQDNPSDSQLGDLESIPVPDSSVSPILEDPEIEQLAQSPKADTRMLEIVNDGLDINDQEKPADNADSSIANADDNNEELLYLPDGADKFNFNPFAAAAKAKIETVNNIEVHVLEFESLVPGVTTVKSALSRWGEPNNKMENKVTSVYQYFRPIKNVASEVQVIFEDGKLTTILIQFEQPETIENLEAQYNLAGIKPIVVRQKDGTPVGQAYPERGASLVYDQKSVNQKLISRLILEPINTKPFVLRAKSTLKDNPTASKADLEFVLNKEPRNADAQWLYGRLLTSTGDLNNAIEHLEKAVFLDNNQVNYYLSLSLARYEAGLGDLADKAADKVIELADRKDNPSPHLAAEAWRIKGDLEANKQNPNFKAAIDLHSKAIVMAQQQLGNPDLEIAQAALETLVDAHLGAARDIAWGNWNQKASSVMRWLNQANKYNEQLIQKANYSERQIYQSRVRVASKALAAIAGIGKEINPAPWAEMLTENGEKLLAIMESPNEKERLMWNIGMSLYDAVQVFQARKDNEMTLKYGQKAVECLEGAAAYANKTAGKVSASDLYIQGRLYFRIGAIYAISQKDHQQAIKWYSKSLPIFETVADAIPRVELGRLGETLVSMGVSYWETGKQTQAVNLTENGIYCLEQAAEEELASAKSLEIPYRNLSMMLNYMGKKQESSQYIQKAEALRTNVR